MMIEDRELLRVEKTVSIEVSLNFVIFYLDNVNLALKMSFDRREESFGSRFLVPSTGREMTYFNLTLSSYCRQLNCNGVIFNAESCA